MIASQTYSPFEMGLGRLVNIEKARFIGQRALRSEKDRGHARQVVGLEIEWTEVERIYERLGLPPAVGATASRIAVPVYLGDRQVGKATSTTWSPVLKRMIALARTRRQAASGMTTGGTNQDVHAGSRPSMSVCCWLMLNIHNVEIRIDAVCVVS